MNIYNALGTVDVVADVEGYFTAEPSSDFQGLFHPMTPVRACDTRRPSPTPACSAHGALGPGETMAVTIGGSGTIPADGSAGAVVVNVTGVAGTAATYLSLSPTNASGGCTTTGTSTVNLAAARVQANRVMVKLGPTHSGGPDTSLCVYNAAGVINVLVDVNGWFGSATATASPAGYQYQTIAPTRICDTRSTAYYCPANPIPTNSSVQLVIDGDSDVPGRHSGTTVEAIIANLTAVAPTQATFLRIYPATIGLAKPNVSDINLVAGTVMPNLVVVAVDATGDAYEGGVLSV